MALPARLKYQSHWPSMLEGHPSPTQLRHPPLPCHPFTMRRAPRHLPLHPRKLMLHRPYSPSRMKPHHTYSLSHGGNGRDCEDGSDRNSLLNRPYISMSYIRPKICYTLVIRVWGIFLATNNWFHCKYLVGGYKQIKKGDMSTSLNYIKTHVLRSSNESPQC